MTFKINKNINYTTIGTYHLRDKQLSLKAKGLLSWMLSNDDNWDYSIKGIVANCKENETAIKTTLNELKKFGYLEVNKVAPNKNTSVFHYEYIIHEKPIKQRLCQGPDFLCLEDLALEDPLQSNIVNNKDSNNSFLGSIKTIHNTNKEKDIDRYIELYRQHCTNFQQIRKLTDTRKHKILALLKEYTWDEIIEAFDNANESDFLQGKCGGTWKADFDFFLKKDKFPLILEGKYGGHKEQRAADGLKLGKKATKEEIENEYIYKF